MLRSFRFKSTYATSGAIRWLPRAVMILTIAGCSRNDGNQSRLELVLPAHPSVNSKSSNLSPQATDLPFCYLVNIVGEGIKGSEASCYPSAGIRSGFLPPLSTLTLDVPKGSNRKIQLFGYIPRPNESCASSGLDLQRVPLNRLFRLAEKENVEMTADEVAIKLEVVHPGLSNHFGVQTQQPSSCYAQLPPILGNDDVTVTDTLRGQFFQLKARVSNSQQTQVQSGSHFQIRYEVQNVHR